MKTPLMALAIFATLAAPAFAADASRQQTIQDLELRLRTLEANNAAMRAQVDASIAALHSARAEIEAIKAAQTAAPPAAQIAAPERSAATTNTSANAFNPAISVVLNGAYAHHSLEPDSYALAGFPLAGEAGPSAQGLSLGESEVALSANIDDKFYGQLTLAAESEDGEAELGIEEAYIETTALPAGWTLRLGRTFSNIGYLNNHHAHTDSFVDRPLAYQAFVGGQYGDDGIQLRWVAPTDTFVELGGEWLRGQNHPSGGAAHDGAGVHTLFAHAGGDVGAEHSWLAGLSMLRARTEGGADGFHGDNELFVADATWRWAPQGNAKDGGITFRTEYFLDQRDGAYVDVEDPSLDQDWDGQRRGGYAEGVWRINRAWDAGYRYDRLWADDSGPFASLHDPYRHSLMLTWHHSEFSLVRVQFSQDHPSPLAADNAFTVQYQAALGAHGSHKF